jgi:hypothetical protein
MNQKMGGNFSAIAVRSTTHSTGPARKAAQAGEFKRYANENGDVG